MNDKTKENSATKALDKPATFATMSGEITLSVNHIKQFVAKGSQAITVAEAIMFIQLCKYNALNPWIGDAFLIKYGSDPATMVTSKYAYMKRAERAKDRYLGFKAGVVLMKKNWMDELNETGEMPKPILMEGSITFGLDLVGGWSEILVKDKEPVVTRVAFDEYVGKTKKGEVNRQWKKSPGTMIRKVALVAGLREAFPDVFGGLYSEEEFPEAPAEGAGHLEIPPDAIGKRPENVTEDGEIVDAEFEEDPGDEKPEEPETETAPEEKKGFRANVRYRRNKVEVQGEEVKTSGVTGAVLTTLKNVYERFPAAKKVIDQELAGIGIKDMTFLRKGEGDILFNLIAKMDLKPPQSDEDRPEEEPDQAASDKEKDQGGTQETPEASKKDESSEIDRNEMIPCPDRGEMEIEFAFCQDQCPKYDQKTCIHFADSPEEATL